MNLVAALAIMAAIFLGVIYIAGRGIQGDLRDCAAVPEADARLRCYDRLVEGLDNPPAHNLVGPR